MKLSVMERTDSSSAMMLLQYGGDDSDEDNSFNEPEAQAKRSEKSPEKKRVSSGKETNPFGPDRRVSEDSVGVQSAGLISDEEVDHHHAIERSRKRDHEDEDDEELGAAPAKVAAFDVGRRTTPSVSPVEIDSNISTSAAQQPKSQKKSSKPAAMRLVSYGTDDLEENENESENESEEESSGDKDDDTLQENSSASPGSKGQNIDANNIQLPPEPPGKCSKMLQDKITDLYNRMKQQGFDTNYEIQRLTSFRNPSIYEKLIQMYHIDEKGSNFRLEVFNPHMWSKDSFYDELDKLQKKDMERREKDRKTKIEFISGTKKAAPSSDHSHSTSGASDEKKRKSKWDALPPGLPSQMHRSSSSGSNMANLTSTATGTRATVISAVGTLTKKAPYNIINSSSSYK